MERKVNNSQVNTISRTDDSYKQIIRECEEYLINAIHEDDSEGDIMGYVRDLRSLDGTWERLVATGLFHDACGKVIDMDDKGVTIATSY